MDCAISAKFLITVLYGDRISSVVVGSTVGSGSLKVSFRAALGVASIDLVSAGVGVPTIAVSDLACASWQPNSYCFCIAFEISCGVALAAARRVSLVILDRVRRAFWLFTEAFCN